MKQGEVFDPSPKEVSLAIRMARLEALIFYVEIEHEHPFTFKMTRPMAVSWCVVVSKTAQMSCLRMIAAVAKRADI